MYKCDRDVKVTVTVTKFVVLDDRYDEYTKSNLMFAYYYIKGVREKVFNPKLMQDFDQTLKVADPVSFQNPAFPYACMGNDPPPT